MLLVVSHLISWLLCFFFYGPWTEYTSSFTYRKWLNVPLLFTDCKMIENSLRDLELDMDSLLVCLRTLVCSQLPSITIIKSDTVLTWLSQYLILYDLLSQYLFHLYMNPQAIWSFPPRPPTLDSAVGALGVMTLRPQLLWLFCVSLFIFKNENDVAIGSVFLPSYMLWK